MPEPVVSLQPRVLHVTSALDPGGVETWLLRLAKSSAGFSAVSAILVLGDHDGLLAPQFHSLGVRLLRMPLEGHGIGFVQRAARRMRDSGPWDVVHSHVHRRSALVQLAAMRAGIPLRVTHSHNTHGQDDTYAWWLRAPGRWLASTVINRASHQRIACSMQAARSLFGAAAARHGDVVHMPYGMDELEFRANAELPLGLSAEALRRQLGIAADATVVGHVGRFMPQKNHGYLLRTAAEALRLQSNLHFLLIGDGPLRTEMEALAQHLGIASRVTFAGHRLDIPLLMRHAMDCFFFPSLWEGLGIVLLEAQVAGLPCLLSECIPPEANVFPARNRQLAVDLPPHRAAHELVSFLDARKASPAKHPPNLPSGYQIQHNARLLAAIYRDRRAGRVWRERAGGHEQPA